MGRRVSIPVKVVRPGEHQATPPAEENHVPRSHRHELDERPPRETQPLEEAAIPATETQDGLEEWRDRALRLQADADNYRRCQRRLAQDQIEAERQRLLGAFLGIVDDLERALAAPAGGKDALRQGVELTHRAALKLLEKEGVEPISAQGQPFDPNWHEAVATIGHNGSDAAPDTVIQVVEPGYRLDDQLLRPAKVVVAV